MTTGDTAEPGAKRPTDPMTGVDSAWLPPAVSTDRPRASEAPDLASAAAETTELTEVLSSYFQMGYFESGYVEANDRTTSVRPGRFESASEIADTKPSATRFEPVPHRSIRLAAAIHRVKVGLRSLRGVFAGIAAAAVLLAGIVFVLQRQADLTGGVAAQDTTDTSISAVVSVVVPLVANLEEDTATNRLNNAGFEVDVSRTFNAVTPTGLVISASPGQGEAAEMGSTVQLVVSRGTEPVCSGAAEDQVRQRLADRELSVGSVTRSLSETVAVDLVIRCVVSDNANTVMLVVSDGPRPEDDG